MGELRRMARAEEQAGEAELLAEAEHGGELPAGWKEKLNVKCPFCAHLDDKVIDSREARTGDLIRRRRECLKCSRRFTTYERIDEIPYMVIKKDGRREKFERQKILQGLLKACEKRPVPVGKLETIVDEAEAFVSEARGSRALDHRDRWAPDEPSQETRQGRLRAVCVRLSRFQGREGIHGRTEGSAEGSREEVDHYACQTPAAKVFTVRKPRCSYSSTAR